MAIAQALKFKNSVILIKSARQLRTCAAHGLKAVRAQAGEEGMDRMSSIRMYVEKTNSKYPAVEWYTPWAPAFQLGSVCVS